MTDSSPSDSSTPSRPDAAQSQRTRALVDAQGTVLVPAHEVPLSNFLSPEARAFMIKRLTGPVVAESPDIHQHRADLEAFLAPMVERAKALFPAQVHRVEMGGVPVFDILPKLGVSGRGQSRVLINLHGGAFRSCEFGCAMIESIPTAVVGGVRVVSVSYRQGPEHRFPAGSEDVAAVYRVLLDSYPAENIGLYGASAGGHLTAESLAWFQKAGLPRPGAAGILFASAVDFGGDAPFVQTGLENGMLAPPPSAEDRAGRRTEIPPLEYFVGVNARDPLVQPAHFPETLRRFPPTLVATGGRAFDSSGAFETHRRLWRAGVATELHVWDGLTHGFSGDVDLPESREMVDVLVRFFDRYLGDAAR